MLELIIKIVLLLTALIGLITAIVHSKKTASKERGGNEGKNSVSIGDSNSGNVVASTEGGDVIINSNRPLLGDKDNKKGTSNQSDLTEIKLSRVYTSIFAEDNKLKTEQISITKQEGSNIEGIVTLRERNNKILTYELRGTFSNKILTAEYYSREQSNDERGSVNLKLITNDIFSGFCSFSKSSVTTDDEIRVSPYIWHEGENVDLLNGTYEFCTECYNAQKVCCCASEEVDMPIFLDSEKRNIALAFSNKKRRTLHFFEHLSEPYNQSLVWQMCRIEKENEKGKSGGCIFFDTKEDKCNIYERRPLDCRLFPFDIKLSDDKTEYIIGYYPDLCERELPYENEMKKYAHILRPYFFLLYPYLHIITSDVACARLKNAEFRKIANFKEFVF